MDSVVTRRSFDEALTSLRHFDRYDCDIVADESSLVAGYTGYPSYPVQVEKRDDYTIYLEGRLYDTAEPMEKIRSLIPDLFSVGGDAGLESLVRETDGEFLACVIDNHTQDVVVWNDAFGRLPVYYTWHDDSVVLSREPGFILDQEFDVEFDPLGIAFTLLFGYTLGNRTLWRGVETIPPGTLLSIQRGEGVSFDSLHQFDFDRTEHADRSVTQNASRLATLFSQAVDRRAAGTGENIVSLSGGHDSRAVATVLAESQQQSSAATFIRANERTSADADIAEEIADALGMEWTLYELPPMTTENIRTYLRLKRGMCHAGISFILQFFEQLVDAHGTDMTYFTGDGGDKAVPNLTPAKSLSDLDDLVSYTIKKNSLFPLEDVAALTGLDAETITAAIRSFLASYPEQRLESKYVHFLTHERGFNWLFEAEDRNRCYFWSTTPFYSLPFFRYAMNVPADQKRNNNLYREFLSALWEEAIDYPDADFRTPMSSPMYGLVQSGLSLLERYPELEDIARIIYRGELNYKYHPNIARTMQSQLDNCDAVREYLSTDALRDRIEDKNTCGEHQIFTLFTIVSAIETNACDSKTFDELGSMQFQERST